MPEYTIEDLQYWNARIVELVREFGLDPYPQEFEICDYEDMLSYMVYSGMPSHYPHWSYGKAYEKLKTLYSYGVTGLPYEMVINSNPSIAYLMRDNTLALQILTIAHVYAHNDFFKNNFTFSTTRAEYTIETFKTHADRVRRYIEDPSVGLEKVERVLDAAHALSLQCRRNLAIRKQTPEEEMAAKLEESQPPADPFRSVHRPQEYTPPDLDRVPLYPDEDLLIFIRDHNRHLSDWEKDLLTIVHEEAQYFLPQIETKIMNEGWASFWHKRILEALQLPQELHLEFLVRHTQVLRPTPGALNPYHVGMKVWEDIEKRWDHPTPEQIREYGPPKKTGKEKLFEVREVERDTSFLRRYLTEELVRDLQLFEYRARGNAQVVTRVADEENWRQIKETLIQNVGSGTIPVIKVEDSDFNNNRTLLLKHYHDGRDLQLEYAEKTLQYVQQLWGHDVALSTIINDKKSLLCYSDNKLTIKNAA
ncbi:MAG TPA: SpoVR family protein [candidate division Zixibacteria bacterium]|nr:SpoVR family protein [candidate division Zixibacteria bacterium]